MSCNPLHCRVSVCACFHKLPKSGTMCTCLPYTIVTATICWQSFVSKADGAFIMLGKGNVSVANIEDGLIAQINVDRVESTSNNTAYNIILDIAMQRAVTVRCCTGSIKQLTAYNKALHTLRVSLTLCGESR